MLSALAITNYRSLRQLVVPLGRLTVVTGPNGSGKSGVYRALRLLAETARGGVVRSLVREGGLSSTLWAGPERFSAGMRRNEVPVEGTVRSEPVNLRLGFSGHQADDFGYAIDIGLPPPFPRSAFSRDPQIKHETIWCGPVLRPATQLVDRKGASLRLRGDSSGRWEPVGRPIAAFASMMTEYADPHAAPEMFTLREQMRSWRFYDHFRSDADAPARRPQLGTYTPVLANDGADLAAALQTIREIGDTDALDRAVEDAFPGACLEVTFGTDAWFQILMRQHGLLRRLSAAELSDGTLRYLLWIAALLTPRPPALMVLNEPETSLHPDLLPSLGRLIAQCAAVTQVIVVTHAPRLIASLDVDRDSGDGDGGLPALRSVVLEKSLGETRIANLDVDDLPAWHWPAR